MKYGNKTFSVAVGGKKFAEGWERVFGDPAAEKPVEYHDAYVALSCTGCGYAFAVHYSEVVDDYVCRDCFLSDGSAR